MLHTIPVATLGPAAKTMAHAIEKCVHCGFCLPTCPTYRTLGEEMDSPRGRILLMKTALEGTVPATDTLPYIDRCLACMACVNACPSGVPYNELLPLYREHAAPARRPRLAERAAHVLAQHVLPSPGLSRLALAGARLARPFAAHLPAPFAAMIGLAPDRLPPARPLPPLTPAAGKRRARIALLSGCVQSVLAPEIGWATLRVLARNGVEVLVPPDQGCCGSLAMHVGELARARTFARALFTEIPDDVDAVVTNAAGCGSAMKEYGMLFSGLPEQARAAAFAQRVRDVSELLAGLGLVEPPRLAAPLTATYHDACHLAHAQRITSAPRELLAQVENLSVVELEESDTCCGSAGTYNLEQPAVAAALGSRKARNILATGAEAVITGNIGCMVQIGTHLQQLQQPKPVWHLMQVLDRAYAGD
jgi:glycolate oxidase iron-sulfur subunit